MVKHKKHQICRGLCLRRLSRQRRAQSGRSLLTQLANNGFELAPLFLLSLEYAVSMFLHVKEVEGYLLSKPSALRLYAPSSSS